MEETLPRHFLDVSSSPPQVLSSEHVAEYTRAALQENAATGDAEGMAARRLVERAIHHQSSDNVSVAVSLWRVESA